MADSYTDLTDTVERLTTVAQIIVADSGQPFEAARELNAAAMAAGIVDQMFNGRPAQIVHDVMTHDRMHEHLSGNRLKGVPIPSKARIERLEDLADLRTVLSI